MKKILIGAILWMVPLLVYGDQESGKHSDQVKESPVFEVFGNYHYTGFDSANIALGWGNGIDAGLRFFPNANRRLGFGFRIGRFDHQIQWDRPKAIEVGQDAVAEDGKGWIAAGDIYFRSRNNRVQPYFFVGLGYVFEEHTYHFLTRTDYLKEVSGAMLDTGVGLKVNLSKHLSVTPDFGVLTSGGYTVVQVGIGINFEK